MQLLDVVERDSDLTIAVQNRMDYMNDGETLNGYERIRRRQVREEVVERERRRLVEISY